MDTTKYVEDNKGKTKEKNKEKLSEHNTCTLCGGTYTYSNSGHHKRSEKHQFAVLKEKYAKLEEELKEAHLKLENDNFLYTLIKEKCTRTDELCKKLEKICKDAKIQY